MWFSALQLFLLFSDVVNSSSNWLSHPFDISSLLGSRPQAPKMLLPLTMSPNGSLGSAQAGLLIGSTERLLVTPSTSQRPQKPGRTIVSYLPLQVNGASSSLLAQACSTYQSPMLTSRLLSSLWTGTCATHLSPQALLTLKPPPPPLPQSFQSRLFQFTVFPPIPACSLYNFMARPSCCLLCLPKGSHGSSGLPDSSDYPLCHLRDSHASMWYFQYAFLPTHEAV